jgi:biotin-dependent carboxylase-like uncharacterized protein
MQGKLTILQPGILSSLQDCGRFGYTHLGVPQSGAMDSRALGLANMILKNTLDCACLEFAAGGLAVHFSAPALICITGAEVTLKINGISIEKPLNNPIQIHQDDRLQIGPMKNGIWGYLGIAGGFQSKSFLGSRSFSAGITPKVMFGKNDQVAYSVKQGILQPHASSIRPSFPWQKRKKIRAYKSSEFQMLNDMEVNQILEKNHSISPDRNRMATPLNEPLGENKYEILTAPSFPGTVQLTPSGKMFILMREAQVTGGYPRILQVHEDDLDDLAQMPAGSSFQFELIDFK